MICFAIFWFCIETSSSLLHGNKIKQANRNKNAYINVLASIARWGNETAGPMGQKATQINHLLDFVQARAARAGGGRPALFAGLQPKHADRLMGLAQPDPTIEHVSTRALFPGRKVLLLCRQGGGNCFSF